MNWTKRIEMLKLNIGAQPPIGGGAPCGGLILGHKAVEMATDHNFVQVGEWASNLIPGLDFCMENWLKLLSSKLAFPCSIFKPFS
jgi:hypothetical protein